MTPPAHILVSFGAACIVGRFFLSIPAFFMTFIGGVIIDADHFLDYFLNYSMKWDLKHMYRQLSRSELSRIYIVLHSYEMLLCVWALVYIFKFNVLLASFAIGYTLHMLIDQLANPVTSKGYFLSYRIYRKFDARYIINKDRLKEGTWRG